MKEIIQTILVVIIALLGFPAGLVISKLAKEELKAGFKWFIVLTVLSFVLIVLFFFIKNLVLGFIFIFIFLFCLASILSTKKCFT